MDQESNDNNIVDVNDYQEQANLLYKGYALAPMVRASTTPLRILALNYGADFTYTEELVDRSISDTIRVVNQQLGTIDFVKDVSKLSAKTRKKLAKQNNRPCLIMRIDPKIERNKIVCQLGSGEPELALPAAKHVYKDVSAIDINMGCPKKFSVSGGMGSALLKDPDRASRIIKTLKAEIPRPISCKIRLLENTQSTLDYVEGMITAGVNSLAIHARRVGQESTESANWKELETVMGLLQPKYPNFPFLINGDFYDRQETQNMLSKTHAAGVLLARPALYNTSIFRPLSEKLQDKTTIVQEYLQLSQKYDTHYKNVKYVICEMISHRRTPAGRVPYLPVKFPGGQTIANTCNCHSMEALFQVWNIQWSATSTSTSKSANVTTPPSTLDAGEHKYTDSYVMNRLAPSSNVIKTSEGEPDAKRIKLGTTTEASASKERQEEEEKKSSEEALTTPSPSSKRSSMSK